MDVTPRLQDIFRSLLEDDDLVLTDALTAADVPGWDSLAHISLMSTIEHEFGVEFDDDQLTAFQNVGELRRFLQERTAA